jgi:hypothetical protein
MDRERGAQRKGLAVTNPLPISAVHNTAGESMNKTAVINEGIAQDRWASTEQQPSHTQPTCERRMDGWKKRWGEERQKQRQRVEG